MPRRPRHTRFVGAQHRCALSASPPRLASQPIEKSLRPFRHTSPTDNLDALSPPPLIVIPSAARNLLFRKCFSFPKAFVQKYWTTQLDTSILQPMTLSARNRLEGTITELQLGGVMAHVVIKVGSNLIESVITRRSAEEMQLKIGDTVSAVIKSTEVMLEKK
jgi:molybdopterin-binding protein